MASAYACPKCQSEDVQKMSAIVSAGTSTIDTESSSSGVAIGYGGASVGGGSTTTTGQSQTHLAKQFSEEVFKDEEGGKLLLGLGLIAAIFIGIWVSSSAHSKFFGFICGAAIFGGAIAFSRFLDKTVYKSDNEEISARQKKRPAWRESGYYCNRCTNKFIPGSNEEYIFSKAD